MPVTENSPALRNYYVNTLAKVRYRARKRGIEYRLDDPAVSADLKARFDRGVCEMTGVRLKMSGGKLAWNSPSLDRKDASRGYVPGNVRIIAFAMNSALGQWGPDKLGILVHGWLRQEQERDAA